MNKNSVQDDFRRLKETIKARCRFGPVYYYANPGNWGDALIRYATLRFFADIGLHYRELQDRQRPKWALPYFSTVIFGGGGAWCRFWDHTDMLTELRTAFKSKVIVLPSTYEYTYSFPRTLFFIRDTFESRQNMPESPFCHDMAFYLADSLARQAEAGIGNGYFFRTDKESSGQINLPVDNVDLSTHGNHFSDPGPFIETINRIAVIHTDRLHVAIIACLLKKEVHMYPGAYFKNRAVYLSSIKGCFDNVSFHEDFDQSPFL